MDRKPAAQKLEAILSLARSDLTNRRKSPWRWIIFVALLLGMIAGFFWWVGTPGPPVKPFQIMASDAVSLPDEPITLIARIESFGDPEDSQVLKGTPLIAQETIGNAQQTRQADESGMARFEFSFAASALPVTWFVRYAGSAWRPPAQARGMIYIRPKSTAWIVIDADHVLPAVPEQEFWNREGIDVPLAPGALPALRELRTKREILYVASTADSVSRCLRLKAWLTRGWAPANQQPPDGPFLSRASGNQTAAEFLETVVKDLQSHFEPPVVALAARPEEAEAFLRGGAHTLLLGDGEKAPQGAIVIKSWSDGLSQKADRGS